MVRLGDRQTTVQPKRWHAKYCRLRNGRLYAKRWLLKGGRLYAKRWHITDHGVAGCVPKDGMLQAYA
jgi:hypothetical protein